MLAVLKRDHTVATLVIRNIEDDLHGRLKASARAHHRSMEEEVRTVLRQSFAAKSVEPAQTLGHAMRALFAPLGGVDLELPSRDPHRAVPDFSEPEWG
jgi:antitoxin FitA